MADLKEEVADLGEKAIGFASNLFKRSTEVARQQARIVGLQTQIMRLRDDKARLYCLMGQKVYALFEKGLVKNADLLALCEQAKEMDRQVDAAEEEIQQLRTGVEVKTQVQDTEGGIEAEPPSAGTEANTSASPAEPFPLPPPPSEPEPPAL
jgi:hypothetical protein